MLHAKRKKERKNGETALGNTTESDEKGKNMIQTGLIKCEWHACCLLLLLLPFLPLSNCSSPNMGRISSDKGDFSFIAMLNCVCISDRVIIALQTLFPFLGEILHHHRLLFSLAFLCSVSDVHLHNFLIRLSFPSKSGQISLFLSPIFHATEKGRGEKKRGKTETNVE